MRQDFPRVESFLRCRSLFPPIQPPVRLPRPGGLIDPTLLAQFPTATSGDMASASWPFLRLQVPHVWRTHSRHVSSFQTGLISIEEALILHNVARGFAGHRALEIGCHFGWSSAHLVAAGLFSRHLDIVDPALAEDDRLDFVRASLDRAAAPGTALPKLWAGFSPSILEPIARSCANAYRADAAPPIGNFDAASCEGLHGWSQDPDEPAKVLQVHLYFGGPAGSGAPGVPISAGVHRDNLCTAIGSCEHGFVVLSPLSLHDGKPREVHAYGIDSQEAPTPRSA